MAQNLKNTGSGKVKFTRNSAYTVDSKGNKQSVDSLQDAIEANTVCGCGITCGCYSYIKLKNYDSTTGETDFVCIWFIDGSPNYGTEAQAKAAIDALP